MKSAKGFAEFQLFMRGMDGVGAASPLKLHPVPTRCPPVVWEAFPRISQLPAAVFQDKHVEEVRKNKEGKDPGEAETD